MKSFLTEEITEKNGFDGFRLNLSEINPPADVLHKICHDPSVSKIPLLA